MTTKKTNIHFICRGNILRSFIAETYLKSLGLKNVTTLSSGTNVDWSSAAERGYFARTLVLLERHRLGAYAKDRPEQLTQDRVGAHDLVICMNQRVFDEASALMKLPEDTIVWGIVDIGEGHRTVVDDTKKYEEEIYQEIIGLVDDLVRLRGLK